MADKDPWSGSKQGSTYTVKYAGGYDAPWLVVNGSPAEIKAQLIEFFGLQDDPEGLQLEDLSPNAVALLATNQAKAEYTATSRLGGSVVGEGPINSSKSRSGGSKKSSGWPGQGGKEKAPQHPFQAILNQIEKATTTQELGRVWAETKATNAAGFADPDVTKAFADKGSSL